MGQMQQTINHITVTAITQPVNHRCSGDDISGEMRSFISLNKVVNNFIIARFASVFCIAYLYINYKNSCLRNVYKRRCAWHLYLRRVVQNFGISETLSIPSYIRSKGGVFIFYLVME